MILKSFQKRSSSIARDAIEGWIQLLANATKKNGCIHVDTEYKVKGLYWPGLYELKSMDLRHLSISTKGPLTSDALSKEQYADLLQSIGPASMGLCFFEFELQQEKTKVSIGWRKAENDVVGFCVGIQSMQRPPEARMLIFQRMIEHTELSRLIRISESPNGFGIEPLDAKLGMHFQISTFGLNAYEWAVCGVTPPTLAPEIGLRLIELGGGTTSSRFAMKLTPDAYEEVRNEVTKLSSAWVVSYSGNMKSEALQYLQEGGTYPGRVPIANWMREYRDDGMEPRFEVDLVEVEDKLFLEVSALAETEKEAEAMLKKHLPKELYQKLSPV